MNNDLGNSKLKVCQLKSTSGNWETDLKKFFVNNIHDCMYIIFINAGWQGRVDAFSINDEFGFMILYRYSNEIQFINYYNKTWQPWKKIESTVI